MTRDEMIRCLVEFSVKTALRDPRRYWLSDLFERGFVGYRRLSERQLRRELQLRGLVQPEDAIADGDPDDSAPEDATAILGLSIEARKRDAE